MTSMVVALCCELAIGATL